MSRNALFNYIFFNFYFFPVFSTIFTLSNSWTLVDELFSCPCVDRGFQVFFSVIIYYALPKCATPKLFRFECSIRRRDKKLFRAIWVGTYFDQHRRLTAFQWYQVVALKIKNSQNHENVKNERKTQKIQITISFFLLFGLVLQICVSLRKCALIANASRPA